jgi:hypothetical protein
MEQIAPCNETSTSKTSVETPRHQYRIYHKKTRSWEGFAKISSKGEPYMVGEPITRIELAFQLEFLKWCVTSTHPPIMERENKITCSKIIEKTMTNGDGRVL